MKELLAENGWLGVSFILTLQFVWGVYKDKNKDKDRALINSTLATNRHTAAIEKLELRLAIVEKDVSYIPKMKKDLDSGFAFQRFIAGPDKWSEAQRVLGEGKS